MQKLFGRYEPTAEPRAVNPSALRSKRVPELVAERPAPTPLGRPSRRRRRAALKSGAVILLATGSLAFVGFSWWDRTTVHAGGPVSVNGGILGQRLAVGEPTSFGGVMLKNSGKAAATLEKVRILGLTGGFEVLGVGTNPWPTSPEEATKSGQAIPAPAAPTPGVLVGSKVIPAATTEVAPGQSDGRIQLRIAARAARTGVARARGVEITYRIGPRRYRQSSDASMYLCAPAADFIAQTCPGDAEGKFDDMSVEVKVQS